MRVLYISYDGALDPLGRSQVVPMLEQLARRGNEIDLLSFEKPEFRVDGATMEMKGRLEAAGVRWWPLSYHKRPGGAATLYDLLLGMVVAALIVRRRRKQLVHARSYPAALIALGLRRVFGVPYVFDIRGLYPEERVEAGIWTEASALFRISKRLERAFFRHAAAVITLTRASVPLLQDQIRDAGGAAPLHVIPITVDLDVFAPRDPVGSRPPTIAYFGSVGPWYLVDEMIRFGKAFVDRTPGGRLRFVVNQGQEAILASAGRIGMGEGLEVVSVRHEEIPDALSGVTATMSFYQPGYSRIATSPTKLGESLALGIPAVVCRGVGDAADLVESRKVGLVADPADLEGFGAVLEALTTLVADPDLRDRCRRVAEETYSVATAADEYTRIYQEAVRA
jgi:glycosyltransferase involved in cell wall biosynthesis